MKFHLKHVLNSHIKYVHNGTSRKRKISTEVSTGELKKLKLVKRITCQNKTVDSFYRTLDGEDGDCDKDSGNENENVNEAINDCEKEELLVAIAQSSFV